MAPKFVKDKIHKDRLKWNAWYYSFSTLLQTFLVKLDYSQLFHIVETWAVDVIGGYNHFLENLRKSVFLDGPSSSNRSSSAVTIVVGALSVFAVHMVKLTSEPTADIKKRDVEGKK